MKKVLMAILAAGMFLQACTTKNEKVRDVWSAEQANAYYKQWGWLRGANFNPSTAINQLEMWQAETFDPVTIDRELGWAAEIGFNCMRVYLHHVAWETDPEGFKKRMGQYLDIAGKHGIATIFVFFDDCWNADYAPGKQPEPKTGVHNSGWLRDPGNKIFREPELVVTLEKYVKDVMKTFANDKRIFMWDVYNEPGNNNLGLSSLPLLKKVFEWGRTVNPSQPLSAGIWNFNLTELNHFQIENSDIISYHNYENEAHHQNAIDTLKRYGKPLVCTEYMARRNNSRFDNIMPILKKENIVAINWGLVAGKSNTIYAWDTPMPDGAEPPLWFHDIFRKDGTPFKVEEIELIKSLTGK